MSDSAPGTVGFRSNVAATQFNQIVDPTAQLKVSEPQVNETIDLFYTSSKDFSFLKDCVHFTVKHNG